MDDCSTDQTAEIALEYVEKDKRIHYFRNETNLRLPRNLNRGFSLAKGEYLTWTSDDNRFRPQAIEKMYEALKENSKAQFVFASCRIIDGEGKEVEYIMVNQHSKKQIVGKNPVGACFMYTRKVYEEVGDYDSALALVEDFDYWQRIFMKYDTVAIEDILYDYRWHDGALTSTMRKDQFNQALEKMLLKNVGGFGQLDMIQKYYYYQGLYQCRENLGDKKNPYMAKYKKYSMIYFWLYRVPNKLRRMINGK